MEKLIESVRCTSDQGEVFLVRVIQEYVGRPEPIAGLKRLELDDGRKLNWISASVFKLVETGEILRRI